MTLKLQQINPKISVSVIWNKEQVFSPIPDPNPLKQEQKKQKKRKPNKNKQFLNQIDFNIKKIDWIRLNSTIKIKTMLKLNLTEN